MILIGSDTWVRRWVRYEIFQSVRQGNNVLGIHINSIKGKDTQTKPNGPNPFNNLAIEFSADGNTAKPVEWIGAKWSFSSDFEPYQVSQRPVDQRGKSYRLTRWCKTYDWIQDDGYDNFDSWIE